MRTGPVVLATVLLLALAGCVPTGSPVTSAPSPSATPVFASDAEALAAAEAAYAAYLKVSAEISADGGANPTLIDPLVTPEQATREHAAAKYYADRNLRTEGNPTFGHLKLEQINFGTSGAVDLSVYTCVDTSAVRILDYSGVDATPANRTEKVALQVAMQSSPESLAKLLVSNSDTWSGTGVC